MAWRGLHLSQAARLSLADNQLAVRRDDGEVRLALEDIAWIAIDTPQATLTTSLITACMEAGIAILTTDAKHLPSGLLLPFHRHHRQAGVATLQLEAGLPLRKRLWQAMVVRKIENQAAALDRLGREGGSTLREMARLVGSGDPDNVEARAARHYWARLWPEFVRNDEGDTRNGGLNYGYAVMRALVARGLAAAGLLPAIGVHHASAANAFNLADDLLEPFRPFVDIAVHGLNGGAPSREELSLADRRALIAVPLAPARLPDGTATVLVASERAAATLVDAFETGSPAVLELPSIPPAGNAP
jgi:CRISPR-associated protein Cas1